MARAGYSQLPTFHADDAQPTSRHRSSSRSPTEEYAFPPPHGYPPSRDESPPHRRRRRLSVLVPMLLRQRPLLTLSLMLIPMAMLVLVWVRRTFDPRGTLIFYERQWAQPKLAPVPPLAGCFKPERVSPAYNVSERVYGARRTDVQAGILMQLGVDCYDFAGTVQNPPAMPPPGAGQPRTNYHTHWRTDLEPFRERQEWMLKSFFATQPLDRARLILWSNGDLSADPFVRRYVQRYPDAFELRIADVAALAEGTALEGSSLVRNGGVGTWIDMVRLLVMWKEGGVWADMDSLLTRDLTPLLEHEFVTQWDCYDRSSQIEAADGALMHFFQHSPYLCEAFNIIAESHGRGVSPRSWGVLLYEELWRRLVAGGIPPVKALPFCFSDAHSCRLDNRLPDPFVKGGKSWTDGLSTDEGGGLDARLHKVFGVQLHGQFSKDFPAGGWVRRLLLDKYEKTFSAREDRARTL